MLDEVWQRLKALETHDLVSEISERIHHRKLNSTRISEIRSAARQAREYFRQANTASLAVRPLLTFYGVASLSRSLTLLMSRTKGENSLSKGHGLETCEWSGTLTSDLPSSLAKIGTLRVRSCTGLFTDLVRETQNRLCLHVRSSAVDWRLNYALPTLRHELRLTDLLERLPDLKPDLLRATIPLHFASISDMKFSEQHGFSASINGTNVKQFQSIYEKLGFNIYGAASAINIATGYDSFIKNPPQFLHSYVQKQFGVIPVLYIIDPISDELRYSQIGITYIISYALGMLARYFPTHWMALIDGFKGDKLWPTLNRAQHYVETVFPELVIELIDDVIANPFSCNQAETS